MEENQLLGVGSRVKHPAFGDGAIIRLHQAAYDVCFMHYGVKSVGKNYSEWEITECIEPEESVTFNAAEKALARVLKSWADQTEVVPLGDKWDGGILEFKPADPDLKSYELPVDSFFHKIVMVRDRLRVMEQRINSSKLTDEEKVNLQQYITRIYGSLTSFNILFKNKEQNFTGIRSN